MNNFVYPDGSKSNEKLLEIYSYPDGSTSYDVRKVDKLSMVFPNEDTYVGRYIICPKELIVKAYVNKIGEYIDFCGIPRKIKDVKITDEFIIVEFE